MTQEKLKRIVTAAAVAGTVLVVLLLAVLVYQIVRMVVLDRRIEKVEAEISEYEKIIEENEGNLSYYESEFYLENKAWELGFINRP